MSFFGKITGAAFNAASSVLSGITTGTKVLSSAATYGKDIALNAPAYITSAFYYVNPYRLNELANNIKLLTGNAEALLPFLRLIAQANEKENKIASLKEFYGETKLKQQIMQELAPMIESEEERELIYQQLEAMSCEETFLMESWPRLHEDPLVYVYPQALSEDSSGVQKATIDLPVDISNRFDGFTYYFETKNIKPSCDNVGRTRENIATFCARFHQILIEKCAGNPGLIKTISKNIPLILSKVFGFASLDGLGAIIAIKDFNVMQFPSNSKLIDKFRLSPMPEQSHSCINFEIDDHFNLKISFTIVNKLAIDDLSSEKESLKTTLQFYSSAVVKINLKDPSEDSPQVELIRSPYISTPKPKLTSTSESSSSAAAAATETSPSSSSAASSSSSSSSFPRKS